MSFFVSYRGMPIRCYSFRRSTVIEKVCLTCSSPLHHARVKLALEHAQAVDFIDRALFTYERSFIGAFNLTSGLNRLDFDRVENRPFFLAIHRQVV